MGGKTGRVEFERSEKVNSFHISEEPGIALSFMRSTVEKVFLVDSMHIRIYVRADACTT